MLKTVLNTQIVVCVICEEESAYLLKQFEAVNLARDKFLEGFIDFQDYCDILQLCDVNVDDYLIGVEKNLIELGL